MNKIDLNTYKENNQFYGKIELLLTVKSFDLQAIRKRYVDSKKKGTTGSVSRREVALGGIVKIVIENGKIIEQEIIKKMNEPRGIAFKNGVLGIASESTVYLINDEKTRSVTNPWFSYIHTIDFHKIEEKFLVASSGCDSVFEYNTDTLEQCYEWFAWENGFNKSIKQENNQDVFVTRSKNTAAQWKNENKQFILVDDPKNNPLPTAKRAAFINSVVYNKANENHFLATFFHEGAVFNVDRKTGVASKVVDGLKTPHGGNNYESTYMATSTGSGEVVLGLGENQTRFQFSNLTGKPEELGEMEWLQNSILIDDNIITIDSNRNAFVVFNQNKEIISMIPYDLNWAIQDLIPATASKKVIEQIKALD